MSEKDSNTSQEQPVALPVENDSKKKKRFCRVGLLAVLCFGSIFLFGFILEAKVFHEYEIVFDDYGIFGLLIATVILAIASLVRIGLKGNELKGKSIAILLLVISCFIIDAGAYYEVPRAREGHPGYIFCLSKLKWLGTSFSIYAEDHNGVLPKENWCDIFVEEYDVAPRSFQCLKSHSMEGESNYCLNQYAAGRKLSELPQDMVLLFEIEYNLSEGQGRLPIKQRPSFAKLSVTSERFTGEEKVFLNQWNQVGGPELLDVSRHYEGCPVLFADGKSKMIPLTELFQLRWDVEGEIRYNKPFPASVLKSITIATHEKIILGILGLLLSACAVYLLSQFRFVVYWKFAIFLGVLSAAAGLLFGFMSGAAYFYHGQVGGAAGLVVGLLAGICFAAIFAGRSNVLKQSRTFKWFMIGVGMITGILCSTFVHIALMIVNEETNPFGIIIGIPYGIFVGGVLGLISYFVIRKFYTQPQGNAGDL